MKIKVGIIGAGNMGKNHIRLAKEMNNEFEFVGVFDPDDNRIQALGLSELSFASEEELIDAADAIIVAAPSSLHKQIALRIADAGKHLLMEKPLALSSDDAHDVEEVYTDKKLVLQVGHVERFNPVVLELEKILRNEDVIAVHIERCSSMDRRISDTDVVYDLMIHDIDILMNALNPNSEITNLSAYGIKAYSPLYMDFVEAVMAFDNGIVASVVSSRTTESKIRRIQVHCRNSYIEADLLNRSLIISRKTAYNLDIGYDPVYRQENVVEKVFVSNEEPLRAELKHFHESIEKNTTPKTNGKTAVRSILVLDEIKKQLY